MSEPATDLKELLIERGFDWAIRMSQPPELAGSLYVGRLDALSALMRERGIGESRPSIEMLQSLCKHSPFKADAFLEALVSIHGPEVLCAAWRVIQGMTIERLAVAYSHLDEFSLTITLRSPYGESEVYQSDNIDDLAFMRHLSKCTSRGRPLINGFHALRRAK